MVRLPALFRLTLFVAMCVVFAPLQAQNQPAESGNHPSKIAFQLLETGLITEGIAHDPQTGTFYISSVRERKIISYSLKQGVQTFSQPGDSLWGVFGMKVDVARRQLWVCSSALPQMKGNAPASDGRTALVAYDLKTKQLLHTYTVPVDGKPHLFGDLTVAKNETVYATDSRTPWLYRLAAGEQTVTPFLTDSLFRSLQGLALSEDEQTLFVADYRYGPLSINLSTKQVTRLRTEQKIDLSGIDGLYYYQNSLIAIQNRVKPYRVIRLYLSAKATSIERVETLEIDHPLITEPTLGVLAGKQFYYVANSQWEAFDEAGKPVPNFSTQKPTILALPLN
jgi:hypothetical protein